MKEKYDNKKKSPTIEEKTELAFDNMPLCCNYLDENGENIDCNQTALDFFGFTDKDEYLKRFYELSPKYQPDGELSSQKAKRMILKAIDEGQLTFEWNHQKLNGEIIPSEITLVRVKEGGVNAAIWYAKDLRKTKEFYSLADKERFLLKEIFDSSRICFAIASPDGTAEFVTSHAGNFIGVKRGDNLFDFLPDKNAVNKIINELREKKHINWYH
ncbi:MAG: PAS domain-containing protein, partial [Endomicrobium sp.]|nr:PAS domain-containing protein [Endomicrobium sp.]